MNFTEKKYCANRRHKWRTAALRAVWVLTVFAVINTGLNLWSVIDRATIRKAQAVVEQNAIQNRIMLDTRAFNQEQNLIANWYQFKPEVREQILRDWEKAEYSESGREYLLGLNQ